IIDSQTYKPVEFAIIEIPSKKAGTTSGINGKFKLYLKESAAKDTAVIKALGYETMYFKIGDATNLPVEISLKPVVYGLAEVTILPVSTKRVKVGSQKKKAAGSGIFSNPGDFIALYVSNPDNTSGIIEKVGFYITKKGIPTAPFRVRIFNADGPNNSPGSDLLQESIILVAEKGNQWVDIDLLKYNISYPTNGFYLAFENIRTTEAYFYKEKNNVKGYGAVVGLTKEFNETLGWVDNLGDGWNKNSFVVGNIHVNPMFRAMILVN
ncbi:MAG: carboxypeptidase-like regulatory domain-containing protein, partial [Hymenobacteraceae bacterium]|nr:carboxypeptidase-like regulatory domain-containing protein [Hymenobacteraceae bacterium]MDX5396243.1 carboxypeptidase-like regulatory domain-containing protein [Hymenobacteraceae bacterium]MDX5442239.1 carboxypeptidase-like regulatory domain-containing protein [Hymenobacteraceae bacterium]MDX5512306.1 carboxypeptidase-like regulatory domain-containing protein [Hymenobacteraceae bacterium]